MSNLDDQTLEILAGLNAAQPLTQQVDYSGFMSDFQPVLNDPNLFVPQQGLLQNTPVLDTLSDLDVMQQRPQSLLDMIDQYPTLESDFQRSFAVNPDTFNMNVYQRLPYDPAFWESFVNQGGGTGSDGIDLTGLGAAGLVAGATSLLGGDDVTTGGTDTVDGGGSTVVDTIIGGNGNDTLDGGTGTNTIEITSNTGGSTTIDTLTGGGGNDIVDDGTGNNTVEISSTGNDILTNTIIGGAGNDTLDSGTSNDTIETGTNYIDKNTALSIIETLTNNNTITSDEAIDLTNTIETTNAAFAPALISGLSQISSIGNAANASSVIETALSGNANIPTGNTPTSSFKQVGDAGGLNLDGSIDASINLGDTGIPNSAMGVDPFGNITFNNDKGIFIQKADGSWAKQTTDKFNNITYVDIDGDPRGLFDRIESGIGNLLSTELPYSIGSLDTVGETIPLVGGILSGLDAIEDGNIANVSSALGGIGASGILGGTATTYSGVPLAAGGSGITTTAGTGIQGLATNPVTIGLLTALTIAQQLAPDPSNKTGFGGFDLGTSTSESFGMEGDKFKQGNVDKATVISEGIGTAINTIASGYGLKTEGDILAQTGNRDPLSITFGDQESEQTVNDRLNYSSETGDIINSNDDIARFYYTGQVGNDGSALADNIIRGTNFLSLKAVANDEDTINMKDFRLPAFSEDKVKNQYLDMGLDETAANALTSASRSGSAATSELLGGLLIANTTNENLFLTDAEKTSLLEKGYTEEQLDEILYG